MTWLERILAAEEREKRDERPFTDDDIAQARSWFTCAVGEQVKRGVPLQVTWKTTCTCADCSKYSADGHGYQPYPVDDCIRSAGQEFYNAVCGQDPRDAEYWLARVEGRALQLKREASAS